MCIRDRAYTALHLIHQKLVKKILIFDCDVHQGDGTAEIFKDDQRVFTVSLHGKRNFPFKKATSDWDVEFEKGVDDDNYITSLDGVLNRLKRERFDLIFFQAGVDTLAMDHLGTLALSRSGMRIRNQKVIQWRRAMGCPMVIFMGGGYSRPIEGTVDAFSDLFIQVANEVIKTNKTN